MEFHIGGLLAIDQHPSLKSIVLEIKARFARLKVLTPHLDRFLCQKHLSSGAPGLFVVVDNVVASKQQCFSFTQAKSAKARQIDEFLFGRRFKAKIANFNLC